VVEGGGLENRFTSDRDGGSNPSPSAIFFLTSTFAFYGSQSGFMMISQSGKQVWKPSGGERAL
jgi:hypothetical protein